MNMNSKRMKMTETGETDWQLAKYKITERGKYLLEHSLWSDCKFLVGKERDQQQIAAHKIFLTMTSPVFDRMFHGEMAEKGVITVDDIQPNIFKAMLSYVYTDTVDLQSFDEACELYYAAEKYMMPALKNICTTYVCTKLNVETACRVFEFGKQFEDSELIKKSMSVIQNKTLGVINHPKFTDVKLSTLLTILDQDVLNINSEIDLFNAVSLWAVAECSRNLTAGVENETAGQYSVWLIAKPAVQKLRSLTVSAAEFAAGPAKSNLLSQSEAFAIIMNLCLKDSCPIPNGFSTSTCARNTEFLNLFGSYEYRKY